MEIVTTDNDSLMTVERLEKKGNNLVVHGEIMGAMPVRAVLTPDQARAALKLMKPNILLFLLTILFRPGAKKQNN
jgi:hypothetical protein